MGAGPCPPERVEMILERVESLPTLGPVAARLLTLTSDDEYDIDEVCSLIETDPSLTARVLALCREAQTRLADRVTTVKRALVALGIDRVRSAVLSVSVFELMERATNESDLRLAGMETAPTGEFDREGFWTHAIGVACAAELTASAQPQAGVRPDEAFVAGLLHDLGRLALDVVLPRAHELVIGLAERRRCASASVEREVFGLDHHQVGRRLAEHWDLPARLADVMWLHSQPREAIPSVEHRPLISMVTVAKAMARELHLGWSGDFDQPRPWSEAARDAELDIPALERQVPALHARTASRCASLGLGEPSSPELLLRSILEANRTLARANSMLVEKQREAEAVRERAHRLEAFCRSVHAGMSASAMMDEILVSACRTVGHRACVGLLQSGQRWQWHHVGGDDTGIEPELVDPPSDASLEAFDRQPRGTLGDPVGSALAWLTPRLDDEPGVWRVVRLTEQTGARARRAAVLIACEDADAVRAGVAAAGGVWSLALDQAIQRERMRRYGEMLASANRALVEAQQALSQRESLARLGELTAGAAHEMNNPLTVISGRAQLLRRRLEDPVGRAAADAIIDAAGDLSQLISDLHMLAEPLEAGVGTLAVEHLLRDAVECATDRVGGADRVRLDCQDGLMTIGDERLLVRAIEEIVINAIESAKDEIVRIRGETAGSDGRLWILVEDRGPGLSERALKHALDPLFSEKPAGRKRGLGLARAHRIVDAHGGTIVLENGPLGGARVTIELPRREGARAAA